MKTSEKLIELADFLDALPDERFDYSRWGYDAASTRDLEHGPSLSECGTVGCAAGWLDVASGGKCLAWGKNRYFNWEAAEAYLDLDLQCKRRKNDAAAHTDFERLFANLDGKLGFGDPSKDAVVARIRACAAAYAKRGR